MSGDNDEIQGERGPAGGGETADARWTTLERGTVVGAIVLLAGGAFFWAGTGQKKAAEQPAEKVVIKQTAAFEPAHPPAPQTPAPVVAAALPTPAAAPAQPATDAMLDKARQAPVMGYTGRQVARNSAPEPADGARPGYMPWGNPPPDEAAQFQKLLKPTIMEGSRASQLGNRNLLIAMGTSIPCVLETALSSDQPGFTSCEIPRDVLSDNGRVVLLEKGTQIVGEYRGGLRRGQSRLFVLWTRAKTPAGVIITLASPATDAIGRAGFDGYVDVHWWERFGSAMLLSVVSDGLRMAGAQMENSHVQVQNTTTSGNNAAAIAVEQSINIPPTLTKHQGELVSIFVARDLDFSSVYRLQTVETREQIRDRAAAGYFGPVAPAAMTK